jgi:PRTRC genetic system ThiF family protein
VLPIDRVVVVGAGGNGSIFMSHLCRIWQAWTKLGGSPFAIELWDDDEVSEANLARQCFCEADIGLPKAIVLAQRLRSFYGIPVKPVTQRLKAPLNYGNTMIVGCVDNLETRRVIRGGALKAVKLAVQQRYWLDLGNGNDFGQVILGGHGLKDFFDIYPELLKASDPKDAPSCSLAEALSKQDLFINSTIAALAGQLLWTLLRTGRLTHHGYIVNLRSGITLPIPV